ncbi:MAG TPA: nitroreductase/quinone reductase family protein [Intrasporangium sp.]|nr:nitroreductase/quinone reductase family protein [Intrasporangium sp.]
MPWPAFLKPAHAVINPVALRLAGRTGSLAVLVHTGRRSGRTYRTPVRAFRRGPWVAVGANFGADSQWVKNVVVTGHCEMVLRHDLLHLSRPRIVPLGSLPPVLPRWYAFGLRHVVRTRECLLLEVEDQ